MVMRFGLADGAAGVGGVRAGGRSGQEHGAGGLHEDAGGLHSRPPLLHIEGLTFMSGYYL